MNNLSNSHTFLPEKCPCSDVTSKQGQIYTFFQIKKNQLKTLLKSFESVASMRSESSSVRSCFFIFRSPKR